MPGAVTPAAALLNPLFASSLAGSDDHLFLAMDTLLRSAESFPRDDPRVGEATKVCLRAHLLRYGRVSDAVLQQLIRARSQTPYYLDRLVWGWKATVTCLAARCCMLTGSR